jgi:hypothetical protein
VQYALAGMQPNRRSHALFTAFLAFLVLSPVLCFMPQAANAQVSTGGSVVVYPEAQLPLYGSIGHNWTITLHARWLCNGTDEPISNAAVKIKVTNAEGKPVNAFDCNTSKGAFSFNYTSKTPAVLTFTPTKLVMQDKTEWNVEHPERDSIVPYLSVTVYWDTFSVALTNSTTSDFGAGSVSVKVTRLLLPDRGLSAYGGPKTIAIILKEVQNANVTINGVSAQETSEAGLYTANVSTIFPTAYTLVTVSEDEWKTTQSAFSPTHSANLKVWLIALAAVAASAGVLFLAFKLKASKTDRNSKRPFLGGVFLLFAALISLYWGAIGVEAVANGFSWLFFVALEACCFLFGVVSAVFAVKRKNQAAAIFAVPVLLVVNSVVAMSPLGIYALPTPWLLIGAVILCCSAGFFFVSNADEEFA